MKLRESWTPAATLAGPQAQLMMTLSAFASIDEAPLPGESGAVQERAIFSDLGQALRGTTATWTPVWVGLSTDGGANMAYIAQNTAASSEYAVVIRGTDFAMLIDQIEDAWVQATTSFQVGNVQIASGTALAHGLVITARDSGNGTTLLEELTSRVGAGSTIFVTGHSLGGALATTVALYLHNALPEADFQVYTFAAPTAGLSDFAGLFDRTFPGNSPSGNSSWRIHNAWDVVPQAWEQDTFQAIRSWYPDPGPAQNWTVQNIVNGFLAMPGTNPYQQPSVNACQLNDVPWPLAYRDQQADSATLDDFMTQVGFQHNTNTYLELLGAPTVAMVASLAPNALVPGTLWIVDISGLGFTTDSAVSFSNPGVTAHFPVCLSPSLLKVIVAVEPDAQTGPCDVTVTSAGGSIPGGTSSFLVLDSA